MTTTTANATDERSLVDELTGALRFILAFYEPGQTHLDTEAWKRAEGSGRRALARGEAALSAAPSSPVTGGVKALERAPEDQAAVGWTLPTEILSDVSRKITDDGWDAPTIEIIEIAMLEAERRILSCLTTEPSPDLRGEVERLREALRNLGEELSIDSDIPDEVRKVCLSMIETALSPSPNTTETQE